MARGLPAAAQGWLLAETLEPGRRLRKLSENITAFFCRTLYDDVAPLDDEADAGASQGMSQGLSQVS